MTTQPVYKVIFQNGGQVFEVFARQIFQSDMWGFIEIEELVFGERSAVLVDPSEEKLKNEFAGVSAVISLCTRLFALMKLKKRAPFACPRPPPAAPKSHIYRLTAFPPFPPGAMTDLSKGLELRLNDHHILVNEGM
ncbi:hypothetical protein MGP2080_01020 [marine gamma proteobacterium HTCC2080]|nr:hypothetical protein MGP2080_01020 [marine gamma proteobacterium HTCC2080]